MCLYLHRHRLVQAEQIHSRVTRLPPAQKSMHLSITVRLSDFLEGRRTDRQSVATSIGPQMCGYKPNQHFEFMRDRSLKLAMRDAAGFHTVLSMAASHLDAMNGLKPGSRALWHRIEA